MGNTLLVSRLVAIALVAALATPASAQPACPPAAPAKLNFLLLDPPVTYSRAFSANDIMDVNEKRSGRVNIGKSGRTMGLATYRPTFQLGGRAAPIPGSDCVALGEVSIRYGFEFHEVLVAKEFPTDSCEYKIVLEHEDTHVKINKESLAKSEKAMRAVLEKALQKPAARPAAASAQLTQETLNAIAAELKPIVEGAQAERQQRNGQIDSKYSYAESFKKCGNWDQGNIFLDGMPKPKQAKDEDPAAPAAPAAERDTDPFGLNLGRMQRPPG